MIDRFLLMLTAVFGITACANRTIIVQEKKFEVERDAFNEALGTAATRLGYYMERETDSTFSLFKPRSNPWGNSKALKVLVQDHGHQIEMATKGAKLNAAGFIAENANEYAFVLNSAVEQELAFQKGHRLFDKTLPRKRWDTFVALTTLNPGMGAYYGYNTPQSKRLAVLGGLFFGILDAGYIALLFVPDDKNQKGASNRTVGILGMVTFRLLTVAAYAVDMKDYRELQELPYYFDFNQINKKIEVGYRYSF